MPNALEKIKHIVVLMLENRSFNHMLGFLRSDQYPIEGLKGDETIPEDPAASPPVPVRVTDTASYLHDLDIDPAHDVRNVNIQLFSTPDGPFTHAALNQGFVFDYAQQPGNTLPKAHSIMRCYAPDKLPVLTTLAQEFAICDHWFASVPGPTWPNRFFVHAATSDGHVDNKLRAYEMRTIYNNLHDAGVPWHIYFHDFPQSLALVRLRTSILKKGFKPFTDFLADAKNAQLPGYAFIEPRYFDFFGKKANDQHPPHDVSLGELLIAEVYEALRNSPLWEQSLLIILSDEHGGIYDHVPPPSATNPDGKNATDPVFQFDRLGVRIPAILVSPYIPKGMIDTQDYDHTSVLATVKQAFNLPNFLTQRDASAHTFETNLSLDAPRSDTPVTLPRPGDPATIAVHRSLARIPVTTDTVAAVMDAGAPSRAPLTAYQQSLVQLANSLKIRESPRLASLRASRLIDNEHDAAVQVRDAATRFLALK
jgi:phospholipase C